MAEPQYLRNLVVPVQVLSVDGQQVSACERPAGGVQDVEGLMDKLAELAEAFVDGTDVGRLFARPLEWSTWTRSEPSKGTTHAWHVRERIPSSV